MNIDSYEYISGKVGGFDGPQSASVPLGLAFEWQKGFEPLAEKISFSDWDAIGFQLGKKPTQRWCGVHFQSDHFNLCKIRGLRYCQIHALLNRKIFRALFICLPDRLAFFSKVDIAQS
nr:hypothetical protein [Qipengyuania aquimaris]